MNNASRHHPILRTEVLTGDAPAEPVSLRIYCKRRGRTMPIAECFGCKRLAHVHLSTDVYLTGIECDDTSDVVLPEDSESEPVGALLNGTVVCVDENSLAKDAIDDLIRLGIEEAPVIDREGHYLGILRDSALVDRTNVDTTLNALTRAAVMYENETVYDAVVKMAHTRQREIVVVSAERNVVGVLRAIDAIRWLTKARNESR